MVCSRLKILCIGTALLGACGDYIDRRTKGTLGEPGSQDKIADSGDVTNSEKDKKKGKKPLQPGAEVSVSFAISGSEVQIRPPVDYYVVFDSSSSMEEQIANFMNGINVIAAGIEQAQNDKGAASGDTITTLMDRDIYPGAGKKFATASYQGVTFMAKQIGVEGNDIDLIFDGQSFDDAVDDWNIAHPQNTVAHNAVDGTVIPPDGNVQLEGGSDIHPLINDINVNRSVRFGPAQARSPLSADPDDLMIPFVIDFMMKDRAQNNKIDSVPHLIVVTDDDANGTAATSSYFENDKNYYALSAWAPFRNSKNIDLPRCIYNEDTNPFPTVAVQLQAQMDAVAAISRKGIQIDSCDSTAASSPEVIADIMASTKFKRWVFPEYYFISEDVDFSKPIEVLLDGKVVSDSDYVILEESYAVAFKTNQTLVGKTGITIKYTNLPH